MIHKVTVQNFKRFKDSTEFVLHPKGVSYLAGGNNSGKSTLLQALAVWEFARNVISVDRGTGAFLATASNNGIGMSAEDFSPVSLPDLKHLWNELKVFSGKKEDGYSLRIRCDWNAGDPAVEKHLEIGLSLSNDRVFMKKTASNLVAGDAVPRVAYLPPFAGITAREDKMSAPQQKRWIGRGLAGATLRNLILQLHEQNEAARKQLKGDKKKIPNKNLVELRKTDPWERLAQTLEEVFKTGLTVERFNDLYHTAIEVRVWDGAVLNKQFKKKPGTTEKDLMVEGSGFLQWLSVYALAVNKEIDVLLLDEPDAHLHPALQGHLTHKLGQLAVQNDKQVLLATHSTTILSETKVENIFRMENKGYLADERGRVSLFVGLGSQYAPKLDQLKRHKRLFLHDGPSDIDVLKAFARTLGLQWPDNLVSWTYTRSLEAREILCDQLRAEIPGLKVLSLQDRDDTVHYNAVSAQLRLDGPEFKKSVGYRFWRRRNIESYLIFPPTIARASNRPEQEVRDLLTNVHDLGAMVNFQSSDCSQTLRNTDGKEVLTKHTDSVQAKFGVSYLDLAEKMTAAEIPDDPKALLNQIITLCQI